MLCCRCCRCCCCPHAAKRFPLSPINTLPSSSNSQLELLRRLVKEGLRLNAADKKGQTPAHAAARANHVGAIAVLSGTERPSSPRAGVGSRPGDSAAVAALNLNARDTEGATPLHHAAAAGHAEAATYLCGAGANVDAADALGRSPAWKATVDGRVRVCVLACVLACVVVDCVGCVCGGGGGGGKKRVACAVGKW